MALVGVPGPAFAWPWSFLWCGGGAPVSGVGGVGDGRGCGDALAWGSSWAVVRWLSQVLYSVA